MTQGSHSITDTGSVSSRQPSPSCLCSCLVESQPSSGRFGAVATNSVHFLCKEGTIMESKHRVWSSKTRPEPDCKKRNYNQDCFGQASTASPCSCLRSWVSQMLITSVLVHTAPSTWAGVLSDETKPEDTYQLLRKAQSAPESPTAAERTFTSGHFPCCSGVLLLCHAGQWG